MALIPQRALQSKSTAILALVVSVIGLAVIPVLTLPTMVVTGVSWRGAPWWTRAALIAGAVLFTAYLIAAKPGHLARHS